MLTYYEVIIGGENNDNGEYKSIYDDLNRVGDIKNLENMIGYPKV